MNESYYYYYRGRDSVRTDSGHEFTIYFEAVDPLGGRSGGYFVYCRSEGGNLAVGGLRDETGGTDHCDRGIGTNKR